MMEEDAMTRMTAVLTHQQGRYVELAEAARLLCGVVPQGNEEVTLVRRQDLNEVRRILWEQSR